MRRILLVLVAFLVLGALALWLLVSAPFLGQMRASLVQARLDKAGLGVTLSGPLTINPGKTVHVAAENVMLNALGPDGMLSRLDADVALSDLLKGKIDPSNVVITGATARLVRNADGMLAAASGKPVGSNQSTPDSEPAFDLAKITSALAGRSIRLVDSHISLLDQTSNFGFDAQLASIDLQGDPGTGITTLQGNGTLNGQPLDLMVSLPKDAPLKADVKMAATTLSVAGAEGSKGAMAALPLQIAADTSDLTQFLKILQLEPTLSGTASARAILGTSAGGDLSLSEIDVAGTLSTGESARISGSIGNLRNMDDATIGISVLMFPVGKEPPPATLVKDLRLTSVHMSLSGPLKGDTQRSMTIATNGFQINTAGVGPAPVQIAQISRGPEGQLVVGSIKIQIGPVGAPWVDINGRADDLLTLSGLDMTGKAAFPLSTIVGADDKNLPTALGTVGGSFSVTGSATALSLTDIDLATTATDLWTWSLTGKIASLLPLEGVNLVMAADVKSAAMLKAMGKEPIDLSPLALKVAATSTDTNGTVQVNLAMQMEKSNIAVDLVANNRGAGPVVHGTVTSDLIRLQDLSDGLRAATEIVSQFQSKAPAQKSTKRPVTRSNHQKADDDVEGITVGLLDKDRILKTGDVSISIAVKKVSGKFNVNDIKADLVVGDGKASFGPLKFAYGGGSFDLQATIDTVKAPKVVHLKGSTSGWDFGEIMRAAHVKVPASGTLTAAFDVSGNYSSSAEFLRSIDGSTTVRMKNGSIDTSLLDLAGLGVVPWLFSKERKEKYAKITCLRAPLEFRNGVVSTKETVVETPQVQLVAYGSINIPKRTLDIAGQPRPVGKPLTRSPWPFTMSGSLTDPKVKVKSGPSRVRRVDGANKMPAKRVPCVPDILQLK